MLYSKVSFANVQMGRKGLISTVGICEQKAVYIHCNILYCIVRYQVQHGAAVSTVCTVRTPYSPLLYYHHTALALVLLMCEYFTRTEPPSSPLYDIIEGTQILGVS